MAKVLGFLNKKRQVPGLVGVAFEEDRIVFAHVVPGQPTPALQVFESLSQEDPAQRQVAFNDTVANARLAGAACSVVLSPGEYQLVLMESPAVQDSEVLSALRWKIKDLINFPLEEAVLDYFPLPEDAYRDKGRMIYVVVMRRSRVLKLRDLVESSGLELETIDIPELAMRNLARAYTDDRDGLAYLDLRQDSSTLNLCRNGLLYLTRHLNTRLLEGTPGSDEWAVVRDRLVLEVQRSLDYFESQMGQPQISRLLLAPGGSDPTALIDELNNAMSVRVELLDVNRALRGEQEIPISRQRDGLLALGAALRDRSAAA